MIESNTYSYGIDVDQFRELIVQPTLKGIELWTPAAENLVLGTALHESHAHFLKQIKGPAIGPYQMEPATFDDLCENFLKYQPTLAARVYALAIGAPDAQEMAGNWYFATAMCRIHYRRMTEPLPPANDAVALAGYWKRHYNTALGKGTVELALPAFKRAIGA